MNHIKNQTFLTNSTDPTNQKFVKEIWRHMWYDHDRREKWDLIWNYYRDRGRTSIEEVYRNNKNKGHKLRIIYRNDPIIHEIECPILPKKEKINKYKLALEQKEKELSEHTNLDTPTCDNNDIAKIADIKMDNPN
jgi:hypothetical protein